ncbi:hypothetical protein MKX01_002048 [Papaver californicum]|nr:hypothetical protein MKX01_002048 [Papaver californicum]
MLELCSVQLTGVKSSDALLSDSQLLFSLLRNCNVSLRWFLLHRSSTDEKIKEMISVCWNCSSDRGRRRPFIISTEDLPKQKNFVGREQMMLFRIYPTVILVSGYQARMSLCSLSYSPVSIPGNTNAELLSASATRLLLTSQTQSYYLQMQQGYCWFH